MDYLSILVGDFFAALPLVVMCFLMIRSLWKSELIEKKYSKVFGSVVYIVATVLLIFLFCVTAPFNIFDVIFIVYILTMCALITCFFLDIM